MDAGRRCQFAGSTGEGFAGFFPQRRLESVTQRDLFGRCEVSERGFFRRTELAGLEGAEYLDRSETHGFHLRPVPQWQQGIYMAGGQMLISADDGDADLDEPDNLYIADLRDGKSYAAVLPFRMMSDFRRAGEIEGLTVDPVTDELLVLSNRGSRIVLGMVRGFYPGYDSELHEVYVYEKVK